MEIKTLNKYKKWFKSKGYEFTDEFWMEDYITDHKFIDIIKLIDNYVSEQTKKQDTSNANLNIGCVSNVLPTKSKFIDLLIENTEHAGRDEGIYFSDTLRYNSTEKDIRDFQQMIKDYKKQ